MLTPGAFERRRSLQTQLTVLRVGAVVCFSVLAVAFWILQVVSHEKYEEMAENNHLRTIPLRAPRGVLFDRNGRVLVENRYSFTISIVREHSANLSAAIQRLAAVTGVDEKRVRDTVQRHRTEPIFRPIPVIEHATFAQVAAVTARRLELPEVVVQEEPARAYPDDDLGAHLFGYVSEVQEAQLDRPDFSGAQIGDLVGQSGIEKTYNSVLMGQDGNRKVVVNSRGREISELNQDDPVDGRRLQLTIDYDLQHALEDAYKAQGFSGAAVLLDPRNGEVLAMTSQPEFDPNDFANGIERAKWSELMSDPKNPLQDRLIQGRYSPGSTFKILIATAALSEGIITPDFKVTCTGSAVFYGHTFECDKHEAHGTLDLRHALAESCDVYFYTVGSMLKIDTIHEYAEKLGLVGKTGIDLPGELESLIPSTEWKMKTTGDRWYPGETISVAIGQGPVSVTPIALSTMVAGIANGGTIVTPHVVKAVDQGQGWQPLTAPAPRSVFPINPNVLEAVRDGLWMAVNAGGTSVGARIDGHDVVGKTGTAQVISKTGKAAAAGKTGVDLRNNAWFVFYAPRDNPQVAGVVMAEHAGYGAQAAVPIAHYLLETFFAKQEGRPLPSLPPELNPAGVITPTAAPSGRTDPPAGGQPIR